MSTFETAYRPYGTAARVAALLSDARTRLRDSLAGFTARLRARRTARMLNELSDRELKDIGLTRSDIGRIVRSIPWARLSD